MKLINVTIASLISASAILAATSNSDGNWPQWRGPLMTGAAPDANPPTTWSATQNIKWKSEVPGEGFSTPIIWGSQIFIQAAVPASSKAGKISPNTAEPLQYTLISFDRDTGAQNWKKVLKETVPHQGHHQTSTFASASPVTDGQHVYAFFGSQGIHCLDMQGNVKWSQDFGPMNAKMGFGEGSSPAIYGDSIVVVWDHEDADFIVALDKNTGKQLWKTPRDEGTDWSTPLVVEYDGKPQVITTATGRIRSYDLATGAQIWEHAGLTPNTIPSPVSANGVVYAMSGFRGNALYAIKLGKTGDLTDTDSVLWKHNKSTPYVPSPLLIGDRLYFHSSNSAILSSFNIKTGKPIIDAERLEGLNGIYASPVSADGRIYIASQNGATLVIKDSDKLEILATNQLDDSFNASPALVGNQLFLRGKNTLYCIAEK